MSDASSFELLVRGAAVGGFIGLAIGIGRGGLTPARTTGALFCLGAAAHTLTQAPELADAFGWAWALVWLFSVVGAGLFWAFAIELFEDRRHFEPWRMAPTVLLLAIGIATQTVPTAIAKGLWLAHNLIGAGLMAHVLCVVAIGWKNDLVEPRRRLRGPLLGAGALYALAVTLVQSGEILWRDADDLSPFAAILLFVMSMAGMAGFLRGDPALFGASSGSERAEPSAEPPPLDGPDAAVAAQLDRLMREERLSREPGLTIAALAAQLGVPEHRLRRLINRRLGHRNFNAFLNQWRLTEAKEALADPAQREVPISTIALDAGFQSLGPFNRAFRAETGLTPSEFRVRSVSASAVI